MKTAGWYRWLGPRARGKLGCAFVVLTVLLLAGLGWGMHWSGAWLLLAALAVVMAAVQRLAEDAA